MVGVRRPSESRHAIGGQCASLTRLGGLCQLMDHFASRGWIVSWTWALAFAAALCLLIPIGGAFQLGEDEGIELMKAYLCSSGYSLYERIWNDQPPLHTAILSGLFSVFGPSVLAARMLALGIGSLLVGVLYELVRRKSGHLAAIVTLVVFLSWHDAMPLMISVMLEPAAMAFALLSCLLAQIANDRTNSDYGGVQRSRRVLLFIAVSGGAMGLALQTKLTAGLFVPALLFCIAGIARREHARAASTGPGFFWTQAGVLPGLWIAAGGLAAGVVWCFFPGESLADLTGSHFCDGTYAAGRWRSVLSTRLLEEEVSMICIAALSAFGIWRKQHRLDSVAFVLFGTVVVVHLFQRPFWDYYTLHFAIPVAWLVGQTTARLWQPVRIAVINRESSIRKCALSSLVLWCLVVALLVERTLPRVASVVCRNAPTVLAKDDPVVRDLRSTAQSSSRIVTDSPIRAFHAGIRVLPELAVLTAKRFWSAQLTIEDIPDWVERYHPEFVYMADVSLRNGLLDLLARDYHKSATSELHIRRKTSP